ncbi:MAG: hypothetical protein ACEQSC_01220 [Candidatus Nanopelagicaceae bacterium]
MDIMDIIFNMIVLAIGRSLDLLSTWYGSPNFDIEVNSWMKRAGWKNVILINICLIPILAIVPQKRTVFFGVLSSLMALRNFQIGTMIRAMGEKAYLETYRQFLKSTTWYFPLIPIVCKVSIYIVLGITISISIGKNPQGNLEYVSTIGTAFLCFGLMIACIIIAQRIEKKYVRGN